MIVALMNYQFYNYERCREKSTRFIIKIFIIDNYLGSHFPDFGAVHFSPFNQFL